MKVLIVGNEIPRSTSTLEIGLHGTNDLGARYLNLVVAL